MKPAALKEIFDPIRSLYRFENPCEELAPSIEFFSESAPESYHHWTGGRSFRVEMYASWTPTMYINLGPSYRITVGKKKFTVKAGEDVLLLRDGYVCRDNRPDDTIFTVKFFPGGLESILGLSQLPLAGKLVPLREVLPGDLLNRVKNAAGFRERKAIVEQFFLQAKARHTGDHYIDFVTDTIANPVNGALQFNVDQEAARRFTTSRTLHRYFNRAIGVSPKKYFTVVRARMALTAFIADRSRFDAELFGYHDSSHFYRDMVSFTGQRMKG